MSTTGYYDASSLAERRGCQPLTTSTQLARSMTLPEQYARSEATSPWEQSGALAPSSAPPYPYANTSLYQSAQPSQQHQPAMQQPQYSHMSVPHFNMAPATAIRAEPHPMRRSASAHARAEARSWTQEQDNRLRAAIAQVSYESKHNGKTGSAALDSPDLGSHPTTKPWARVMSLAFPSGEHSKEECQSRWKSLHRPPAVKGAWSKAEDDRLLRLVRQHGAERWVVIAQHMGSRSGKQCRERWHNHVDPSITRRPFTPEEDAIILSLYNTIGSKWAEMSKRLKGRPDNSIKNHFNTTLSRRRMLAAAVNKASNLTDEAQGSLQGTTQASAGGVAMTSTSSSSSFTSSHVPVTETYEDSGYYSSNSTPAHKQELVPDAYIGGGMQAGFDARRSSAPILSRQHGPVASFGGSYAQYAFPADLDPFVYTGRDGIVYRHNGAGPQGLNQSQHHRASVPNSLAYSQMARPDVEHGLTSFQHGGNINYSSLHQSGNSRIPASIDYAQPAAPELAQYQQLHGQHAALWSNASQTQQLFRSQPAQTPGSAQTKSASPSSASDNLAYHSTPRRNVSGEQPLAESLSAWQSVNGERALPPLSLVATGTATPSTPSRARVTSVMRRLTSSACGTVTTDASQAGTANAALAMVDVDEGQKAALPPLFRQAALNTTPTQRGSISGQSPASRTPSYGSEHVRSATRRSFGPVAQETEWHHERQHTARPQTADEVHCANSSLGTTETHDNSAVNGQDSESDADASGNTSDCPDDTPSFTTGTAYFAQREGLSMPGSAMTAASSLLPSPMDCMSDNGTAPANDYFATKDNAAVMDRHVQYSLQQGATGMPPTGFSPYNFVQHSSMGLFLDENESRDT